MSGDPRGADVVDLLEEEWCMGLQGMGGSRGVEDLWEISWDVGLAIVPGGVRV